MLDLSDEYMLLYLSFSALLFSQNVFCLSPMRFNYVSADLTSWARYPAAELYYAFRHESFFLDSM